MLIIRKEMTKEIVEYIASDNKSLEIEKYNMQKDGTQKKNKFINLNESKIHGRFWLNAGKLFEYLVYDKGFVVIEDN